MTISILRTTKKCHTWNTSNDCRSEAAQVQPSWSGRSGKRYGAVTLRPFSRRQHENRIAVNINLSEVLYWRIDMLRCLLLRAKCCARCVVIMGPDADVGVVTIGEREFLRSPRECVYCGPHNVWTDFNMFCETYFEIEVAVDPWSWSLGQDYFDVVLWRGDIDNFSSQAVLIKGSSSVLSGDIIADITWKRIVKLRMSPMVSARRNQVQSLLIDCPKHECKAFVACQESLESCCVVWSSTIDNYLVAQASAGHSRMAVRCTACFADAV